MDTGQESFQYSGIQPKIVACTRDSNRTGQCSATFRDKGTEVSSLFWDKGTLDKLKMGRDRTGRDSLSKSCFRTSFLVLEHIFPV